MSYEIDLTTLTAAELVAYGEQVGWSTQEVREALAYRQMLNQLDGATLSLHKTLNDPTVLEAARLCEEPKRDSWITRLWRRLVH